jgi:predicted O-methyltransferase YrrM
MVVDRLAVRRPLVPKEQLQAAYEDALLLLLERLQDRGDPGDYIEFGVCRGDSMACIARASSNVGLDGMRLIGFDSFEGLPASVELEDNGVWRRGQFKYTEAAARRSLQRQGVDERRVVLRKGWLADTATPAAAAELGIEKIAIAMIDCDVYSSARTALELVGPLLGDSAVIFFDDWHSGGDLAAAGQGEARAFQEFLAERPKLRVARYLTSYADNAEVVLVEKAGD